MADMEFADEPFSDEPAPRTERIAPKPQKKAPIKTVNTPAYKQGALTEPLTVAYGFLGMGVGILEAKTGKLDMPVGSAIVESSESCAEAWDKAAKTSPTIRRVMYKLVGSSNALMLIGAHAPIAVAVSNQIPAVNRLAKRVGTFLERMVNVDVEPDEYASESDGYQYPYPTESA